MTNKQVEHDDRQKLDEPFVSHDTRGEPFVSRDDLKKRGESEVDYEDSVQNNNTSHNEISAQNNTETHNEDSTFDKDSDIHDNTKAGDNDLIPDSPENMQSPGTRLHNAREQTKMSVKHIADKLYLDNRVIEALENDEYDRLPPTIFVRGYLRNYAKLLEISPDSIIESFERIGTQTPQLSSITTQSKRKKPTTSQDLWPTVGTFFVVITLIILAVLWQFYPKPTTDQVVVQAPSEKPTNHDGSWPPPGLYQPVDDTIKPTVGDSTVPSVSEVNHTHTKPAPSGEDTEKSVPPIIPAGQQTMRVHFKDRSWMRIIDKKGQKLYDGIANAGKKLPVDGFPPFKVEVGNVDGVDIEYNGSVNEIKTYPKQRGRRQTFIVGSKE
jgi:cytoskeleton protein RodZ